MKTKGKEVKATINSLAESAEEMGKIVTDTLLTGSKKIRTSILETSEEEKGTIEGTAKDTFNVVVETAESVSGAIADNLFQGSRKIRKQFLDENDMPGVE